MAISFLIGGLAAWGGSRHLPNAIGACRPAKRRARRAQSRNPCHPRCHRRCGPAYRGPVADGSRRTALGALNGVEPLTCRRLPLTEIVQGCP